MSFQGKLGVPGLPGYPGRQGIKVNKNNIVYDASCVIYNCGFHQILCFFKLM